MSDRAWVFSQLCVLLAALVTVPLFGAIVGWPLERPTLLSGCAGAAVIVAGMVVEYFAATAMGRHLRPAPTPAADAEFISHGIFARVRHPLYLGLVLIALGWWLVWPTPPAIAAVVGVAVFFESKARREEQLLRERFPAYSAYMERVPHRILPGIL